MTRECMDCGNREPEEVGRMCPNCGGPMEDKLMYEITCEDCGVVDVHETRSGAEGRAERHIDQTNHECDIVILDS
jgi:reverse gyrase